MHDIRFSDAAVFEAIEAKEWYRLGSAEKSRLFEKKVDDAVLLLRQFPKIGSLIESGEGARRLLVTGFPYYIVYEVQSRTIHVVAFAHTSRDPESWRSRPKNLET